MSGVAILQHSKSQGYDDAVAVAAHGHVLPCGDASVNHMIYARTAAVDYRETAVPVAPYAGACDVGVEIVIETVSAAAHDALRIRPAALTEGDAVIGADIAAHADVAGAIQSDIAEHIVAAEIHPGNVEAARCRPSLRRGHRQRHCEQPGH